MLFVADAVKGFPVGKAKLDFFGYKQDYINYGKKRPPKNKRILLGGAVIAI